MKNLNIPEIGDVLTLSKDWKFTLHAENRNATLAEHFGYFIAFLKLNSNDKETVFYPKSIGNYPKHPPLRFFDLTTTYGGIFNRIVKKRKPTSEEKEIMDAQRVILDKYEKDLKNFEDLVILNHKKTLDIILPKKSKLKVERVYIRKGASDFSSLTFSITLNKKRCRFWAKLSDCNNIKHT